MAVVVSMCRAVAAARCHLMHANTESYCHTCWWRVSPAMDHNSRFTAAPACCLRVCGTASGIWEVFYSCIVAGVVALLAGMVCDGCVSGLSMHWAADIAGAGHPEKDVGPVTVL